MAGGGGGGVAEAKQCAMVCDGRLLFEIGSGAGL